MNDKLKAILLSQPNLPLSELREINKRSQIYVNVPIQDIAKCLDTFGIAGKLLEAFRNPSINIKAQAAGEMLLRLASAPYPVLETSTALVRNAMEERLALLLRDKVLGEEDVANLRELWAVDDYELGDATPVNEEEFEQVKGVVIKGERVRVLREEVDYRFREAVARMEEAILNNDATAFEKPLDLFKREGE